MFEELIFMIGFWLLSIVISYLLFRYICSPLDKVVRALAIVGIIIHELCHLVMCIITKASVKNIKLIERTEKKIGKRHFKYEYSGRVVVDAEKKLTFLQAVLISLAPLIFSFWLFFFLWDQLLLTANVDVTLFFLILFVMVSIVLASAPSAADLLCVPKAFQEDPKYSVYQIFLLILSIILIWIVIIVHQLTFFHEIVIYILIMFAYYGFKYGFKGINLIILKIFPRKEFSTEHDIKPKSFSRRRNKPVKPKKLGFEEPHW